MDSTSKTLAANEPAAKRQEVAPQRVGVGIGVVLFQAETRQVLLGLRKGSHGANTWALPGGWLEVGETFEQCALRELQEETGYDQGDVGVPEVLDVAASNNIMLPKVHSVSVFVKVPLLNKDKRPKVMEPDKCERWQWFSVGPRSDGKDWPENMFPSARYLLVNKHHLLDFSTTPNHSGDNE